MIDRLFIADNTTNIAMIDKINLFHLALIGTSAGVFNWLSTNNIGFWLSLLTAILVLLLTIRKFIVTIVSDYGKWRSGKLFDSTGKTLREDGK